MNDPDQTPTLDRVSRQSPSRQSFDTMLASVDAQLVYDSSTRSLVLRSAACSDLNGNSSSSTSTSSFDNASNVSSKSLDHTPSVHHHQRRHHGSLVCPVALKMDNLNGEDDVDGNDGKSSSAIITTTTNSTPTTISNINNNNDSGHCSTEIISSCDFDDDDDDSDDNGEDEDGFNFNQDLNESELPDLSFFPPSSHTNSHSKLVESLRSRRTFLFNLLSRLQIHQHNNHKSSNSPPHRTLSTDNVLGVSHHHHHLHSCDSPSKQRTNSLSDFDDSGSDSLSLFNELTDVDPARRPSNLPPKPLAEQRAHAAAFQEIMRRAKKRECIGSGKSVNGTSQQVLAQEEAVSKSIQAWTKDVIPFWDKVRETKRTRELWWNGIPSAVRCKVWPLAIGNSLKINTELYRICVERSNERIWTQQFHSRRKSFHEDQVSTLNNVQHDDLKNKNFKTDDDEEMHRESTPFLIRLDVSRTFPQLGLFHREHGPLHSTLANILAAYAVYRPDLGYCQGMSFLAAMLLLNMDSPSSTFISFANLLNNDLLLAFYHLDQSSMCQIYAYYEHQLQLLLPTLHAHFGNIHLTPDLYLRDQIFTLFAKCLPLEVACRVWDLVLRDGNAFVYRASLALLVMYEQELMRFNDFVGAARFLSKLPDSMDVDKYFKLISKIKLTKTSADEWDGSGSVSMVKKLLPF